MIRTLLFRSFIVAMYIVGSISFAYAQDTTWIDTVASEMLSVLGTAVPVLVGLALALFLWGGVLFIASAGNDASRKEGQIRMLWGIVALFVIVTVWGLVQLAQAIFGLDDLLAPDRPSVSILQMHDVEISIYRT